MYNEKRMKELREQLEKEYDASDDSLKKEVDTELSNDKGIQRKTLDAYQVLCNAHAMMMEQVIIYLHNIHKFSKEKRSEILKSIQDLHDQSVRNMRIVNEEVHAVYGHPPLTKDELEEALEWMSEPTKSELTESRMQEVAKTFENLTGSGPTKSQMQEVAKTFENLTGRNVQKVQVITDAEMEEIIKSMNGVTEDELKDAVDKGKIN